MEVVPHAWLNTEAQVVTCDLIIIWSLFNSQADARDGSPDVPLSRVSDTVKTLYCPCPVSTEQNTVETHNNRPGVLDCTLDCDSRKTHFLVSSYNSGRETTIADTP